MHELKCEECGQPFQAMNSTAKRCSDRCRRIYFKRVHPELKQQYSKKYRDKINEQEGHIPGTRRNKEYNCVCKQCQQPFMSAQSVAEFCSHKCRLEFREKNPDAPSRAARKIRHEKVCEECGNPFVSKTSVATTCGITCRMAQWRKRNPEKSKAIGKKHKIKHKDLIREKNTIKIREKYHANPAFRMKRLLSTAIRGIIKRRTGARKHHRTIEMIGCSWEFLRAYIESMWREGMTWETHGVTWEVDHIVPISSFDLMNPSEQLMASNYSNLQPLYCDENAFKKHHIMKPEQYLRTGHKIPAPISLDSWKR